MNESSLSIESAFQEDAVEVGIETRTIASALGANGVARAKMGSSRPDGTRRRITGRGTPAHVP
jgi:hypothetical protein